MVHSRGGFSGGGGGANAFSPQGFDLLPTQRVHPLYYFEMTDPKNFLKAPLAPIYSNLEGESAPKKKRDFLGKIFQKVSKNAFFTCLFKVLPVAQKIWPKQRVFSA